MQEGIFPVYTNVSKQPEVKCYKAGEEAFRYPFFNEGVAGTQTVTKGISYSLADIPVTEEKDSLHLAGFIFHTSHCGSTLLARMLGALPRVRMVSETEAINGLLLSGIFYNLPVDYILTTLQKIINAYRQPLNDQPPSSLLFKLTSWNVFFIHLFQKLYPSARWVYIDRDTEQVASSLLKNGGGFAEWYFHQVPSLPEYFLPEGAFPASHRIYLMRMIEAHRQRAYNNKNELALFLDYPGFITQFKTDILTHFNITASETEIEEALQMQLYAAKSYNKKRYNL